MNERMNFMPLLDPFERLGYSIQSVRGSLKTMRQGHGKAGTEIRGSKNFLP